MTYEAESLLKPSYKKFKNRTYTLEDLSEFNNFDKNNEIIINKANLFNPTSFKDKITSYEIGVDSGFYYIPNPFNLSALAEIIVDSLCKWPNSKHRMNVDIENERPDDVWDETLKEFESGKKLQESWLYKLRWSSLGYHYQWTDRVYKKDCHSPIPANLNTMMKDIINILGWKEFMPEAAIVNYYHLNSAMCFHQDHAELAKDVPLVSISLGQPGVYLLGTSDPRSVPIPVTLYHGDVVVMSGASRLAYHAVPKIVKMNDELLAEKIFGTDTVADAIDRLTALTGSAHHATIIWQYLTCSRINVNMRQVLDQGQDFP